MGISIVSGVNWTVEGGMFTIFDQKGFVRESKWVVSVDFLGGALSSINPSPIKRDVEGVIAGDIRDGNGDKIAYVGVGPFQGLLLALEGVITLQMLRASTETPDRIIMDANLGGVERKLVVLKETAYTWATFDGNDEVV
ncbi:MAG TPA: hypothetical protein VLG36_02760 [Candidatus Chromulinivoraceae bacterium]|nr:hypothetical protein [Candidatus Chromulinivoraceae bacterium]